MKFHPASNLFPMLDDESIDSLSRDIEKNGQRMPIIMIGEEILDGRNRWIACKVAGVEPKTKQWAGKGSPTEFVLSINLHRRHLTPVQKAAIAMAAMPLFQDEAQERMSSAGKKGGKTGGRGRNRGRNEPCLPLSKQDESKRAVRQAAKATGAGIGSIAAIAKVKKDAPEVLALVQKGKVKTVASAVRLASLPEERRSEVVDMIRNDIDENEAIKSINLDYLEQIDNGSAAVEKNAKALSSSLSRLFNLLRQNKAEVGGLRFMMARATMFGCRTTINNCIDVIDGNYKAEAIDG